MVYKPITVFITERYTYKYLIIYANGSFNLNIDGIINSYAYHMAISINIDY